MNPIQEQFSYWTSAALTIHQRAPSPDSTICSSVRAFLGTEDLGPVFEANWTRPLSKDFMDKGGEHYEALLNTLAPVSLTFRWGTIEANNFDLVTETVFKTDEDSGPTFVRHGLDLVLNNRQILWNKQLPSFTTKLRINKSVIAAGTLDPDDLKTSKDTEYLVYVEGKKWPTVKHFAVEKAEAEAKRLLDLEPDKPVHVIRHHCTYKYVRQIVRTES